MDSSPQGIRRVPSSGTGGIKRVPSGGTGGTYDVLSPVGSHGMSLDYGKTTKTHNRTTHSHSQSKTSKRQSKVAWTILRDNTPRKDSWMSLMQMANSKRHSLKGGGVEDIDEDTVKAERERAEALKMKTLYEQALSAANAHSAKYVDKKMQELALRERSLVEFQVKLEAKLEQIPPDIKASLGISTSHTASIFSSMGESVTSSHFRNSGKDVFSSQGMTAISVSELSALRTRLKDYEKAEELRQKLVAENRLAMRRNEEKSLEEKHARASHKIMNNWRMGSCRKCLKAWAEMCAEARINRRKMKKALNRITLQTVSKSFQQWVVGTQNSVKIAEQKAMEDRVERTLRAKLYSSFSQDQIEMREGHGDPESVFELLKLERNKVQSLECKILDMEEVEAGLRRDIARLEVDVDEAKHSWDSKRDTLIRKMTGERRAAEEEWAEKYATLDAKYKKLVVESDAEITSLLDTVQTVQEKEQEWKSLYEELQSISDAQMAISRRKSQTQNKGSAPSSPVDVKK